VETVNVANATRKTVVVADRLNLDGPNTVLTGILLGTKAAETVWFHLPRVLVVVSVVRERLPATIVKLVVAALPKAT
jgi:hypothetical protein